MSGRRTTLALLLSALTLGLLGLTGAPVLAATPQATTPRAATPQAGGPVTSVKADGEAPGTGKMMLLLDSSGSMKEPAGGGQTKIAAAKKALGTVVEQLPSDASVGLRVFGAKVFSRTDAGACTDSQQVVAPGTDNRSQLTSAIARYQPYGETPIPYALQQAAKDLGSSGPRSIVLVSDGESTCPPSPCTVAAQLAKSGIDLHIDVVGLSVKGSAREQLKCIADQGRGTYYDADSAADIESRIVRVAQRAVRPFTVDGRQVTGGTQSSPTPLSTGDSQDVLTPQQPLYYSVERKQAGTTLRIAAYLQESQGNRFLNLEVLDPSGTRCAYQTVGRSYDSRNVLGAQVTAGPDGTCGKAGTYLVKVSRNAYNDGSGALPLGLRVTEEPKIESPGFSATTAPSVTAPQVSGSAASVTAGASFDAATELRTGAYASNTVPGEVDLYRFHLDYGQSARISVTFPGATAAQQQVIGKYAGPIADLALYSPMRARLAEPVGSKFSSAVGVSNGGAKAVTLTTATPAVSATAPVATGQFGAGGDYQTSGDYFLAVSLQKMDYTVQFPYTVEIQVVGDAQAGPTYAGGEKWDVADGTTTPASSTNGSGNGGSDPSRPSQGADQGSGGHTLLGVLVALLGLAAVGGGAVWWRRSRA